MSKDKLTDIKDRYMGNEYDYALKSEDIDWLIEQAELVQELEDRHYRQELIDEHIERLEKQNKRYREALENIMYASATIYSHEMISAINKTALKALDELR